MLSPFAQIFSLWTLAPGLLLALDRVVLQNGAVLEGRILTETDTLIEIRIGEGQVVGVSRKSAKEIFRDPQLATQPLPEKSPESLDSALPLGEEHFLGMDREGKTIAACRLLIRRAEALPGETAPGYVLEEHWTFPENSAALRVSWIETVHADLSARELLYREEGPGAGRVAMAKIDRDRLIVEIHAGGAKNRIELPWSNESRFPLSLRAHARVRAQREKGEFAFSVFDVRRLVFERRHVVLGEREPIAWEGEQRQVFRLRWEAEGLGAWEDWVDPRLGTLRRECNGSDLVARRASPQEIESFLRGEASASPERVLADSKGRFRLRLADSSWKLDPASEPDSLLLHEQGGGKALLFFLDGVSPGETASARLPLLERKLREGLEAYRRREGEFSRKLQGREAIEISFTFEEAGDPRRALALLLQGENSSLVVLYSFSFQEGAAVPSAWEKLLARIELP